jgi:hypothetical protein
MVNSLLAYNRNYNFLIFVLFAKYVIVTKKFRAGHSTITLWLASTQVGIPNDKSGKNAWKISVDCSVRPGLAVRAHWRVSLLFWAAAGPPRRHIDVGNLSLGSRPFAPYSRSSAANDEYGQIQKVFIKLCLVRCAKERQENWVLEPLRKFFEVLLCSWVFWFCARLSSEHFHVFLFIFCIYM